MRRLAVILLVPAFVACGIDDADTSAGRETSTADTDETEPETVLPVATTAPADSTDAPPTPTTTAPTSTTTTAPTTTAVTVVDEATPGEELIGRWAHYDVVAYEDGTLKTLIISYGFNDFTEVDGQIIDAAQFCFSEQRTDQPIETSLSDAATQAIKPPPTPIEIEVIDGTLTIHRDATPTPVGIRLENPATDPLPTDRDDPRIVDDDGDGKPGITVSIKVTDDLTGELYIARREIFAYDAELVEPDVLEGTVTDNSEQLVIGASDPIFDSSTDWEQYPDPAKNPIILRRVDADWDCDRLAAERDSLFPPTPTVDW